MHITFITDRLVFRVEWRPKRKRHHMRTRREKRARRAQEGAFILYGDPSAPNPRGVLFP